MSKSDLYQYLDVAAAACGYIFTRSLAKFAIIKRDWDKLKNENILMSQSLKKAWENIDRINHHLNENGDNKRK